MMGVLRMVSLTDPGRVRAENEDSVAVEPNFGLAVLADGMGGHLAGEVASGMAVDIIRHHFIDFLSRTNASAPEVSACDAVGEAIRRANSAIYDAAHVRPDCSGMGSTVVVAVFDGDRICIGHVGDSRLYRLRNQTLVLLTEDHSVVQELVNRGLFSAAEARQMVGKNLVTRALGVDANVTPDIAEQALHEADIYLLCSDGLNDVLTDREIEDVLVACGDDLNDAAHRMVDLANERGGPDNVSVILARSGNFSSRIPRLTHA